MKAPQKTSESVGAFFVPSRQEIKKNTHTLLSVVWAMWWAGHMQGGPGSCCNCPCRRWGDRQVWKCHRFTSPPGWVPYCWGCPVTERTKKSRRCPRSSRESPTQRKTPERNRQKQCVRIWKYVGFYFENLVFKNIITLFQFCLCIDR